MAKVDPVYSNIPPVTGDVDYTPLGGKVGVDENHVNDIITNTATNPELQAGSDEIEAGYGKPGDGPVLDHVRRRNLGLI